MTTSATITQKFFRLVLALTVVTVVGLSSTVPARAGGPKPNRPETGYGSSVIAREFGPLNRRTFHGATPSRPRQGSPTRSAVPGAEYAALDRANDTFYVGGGGTDGTVAIVDARGCNAVQKACRASVATTSSGHGPTAVVVDEPTHTVYQAYADDGTIAIIDGKRCNVHVRSGCSAAPTILDVPAIGLTVDPRTRTLYAASGDAVRLINLQTCNAEVHTGCDPIASIPAENAFNPAVDDATDTLYLPELGPDSGDGTTLTVVDLRTCHAPNSTTCIILTHASIGSMPLSALVDTSTDTVYVSLVGESAVAAIRRSRCNTHDVSGCAAGPAPIPADLDPFWLTLDSKTHTLLAISDTSDTAGVIDTRHCNAAGTAGCNAGARTRALGGRPSWAMADPATRTLFVAESADGYLSAYDSSRCNALTATSCRREAPTAPGTNCCSTPDFSRHSIYHSIRDTRQIGVTDTATCNTHTLAGCQTSLRLADVDKVYLTMRAVPATHTLYAYDLEAGQLDLIDTSTCNAARVDGCTPVASIHVPSTSDVYPNFRTGTLYIIRDNGDISVVDGRTCNAGNHAGCPTTPFTVQVADQVGPSWIDEVTNTVYVAIDDDRIAVLDGNACDRHNAGCRTLATAPAGPGLLAVAGDPATHTVYATNFADGDLPGTVTTIDTRRCTAADTTACQRTWPTIPTPRSPFGVVVDTSHHSLWVTHFLASRVSVYDTRHCNALDRTGCGRSQRQIATDQITAFTMIDPRHRTAYVVNGFERNLSIISTTHPCRPHLCF